MKTKLPLIIAFLLGIGLNTNAQLVYKWAGNPANSFDGKDIKTGPGGEVYQLERSSIGFPDYMSLRRLDPVAGTVDWAISSQGPGACYPERMAIDNAGNIYVAGEFSDTIRLNMANANDYLYSPGGTDIFIAKYNAGGTFQWAKRIGTAPDSYIAAFALTTDANNNILVSGYFYGTTDFDPSANPAELTSNGGFNDDLYIAKYDTDGNYIWAINMGSVAGGNRGYGIATDALNNIYLTGNYIGTVDFDPSGSTSTLTSTGSGDAFIAMYNANGSLGWVKGLESSVSARSNAITLDAANNIYITGTFKGGVDMDPGAGTANITANNQNEIFIAKYTDTGNYIWAKSFGSTLDDGAFSLALDNHGNLYTTGYFSDVADFDAGVNVKEVTANGFATDIFITKYDTAGNYVWVGHIAGGPDDDGGRMLAVYDSSLYITGYFASGLDVNIGPGSNFLSTSGDQDAFFVKYRILNSDAAILTFSLPEQVAPATIDAQNRTIHITVNANANLAALTPTITVSPGARLTPGINTTQNFTTPFTYLVEAEDSSVLQDWVVTVTKLVGIDEDLAAPINIYPNPAKGLLYVNTGTLTKTMVELYDVSGCVMFTEQLANTINTVDITNLVSGIYFYKLYSNGRVVHVGKVVVN